MRFHPLLSARTDNADIDIYLLSIPYAFRSILLCTRAMYCLIMTGPHVDATIPIYTCSQNTPVTMTESPLTIPQWQALQATAPRPVHLLFLLERAQPNPLNA